MNIEGHIEVGTLSESRREMTPLSDDKDHYNKCMQVYIRVTDRINALKAFFEERFHEGVVEKIDVVDSGDKPFTLKTLGVGCGAGLVDWTIMKQLSIRFPRISHTALEPYNEYIDEYKSLVQREPIPSITGYDWRRQTWEQFFEHTRQVGQPSEKYHFISAISVMYYLHSWKDSVLDMYDHLENGGILVIHVVAEDAAYLQAGKEFPALYNDRVSTMTSDIIKDFLSSKGIPFTFLRHDHYADISVCFKENHETGSLLLDYLTHVKDFESSSPKQLVEDFRAYLKNSRCSRQDNGAVMLNVSTESLIVKKESSV